MIVYNNTKIRPEEIWYLYDNELFEKRRIEIAHSNLPDKDYLIVRFVEHRITDGKVFDTTFKKRKAEDLLKQYVKEKDYSSHDVGKIDNKCLYGFRYGINKEKVNKQTGQTEYTQSACDFFGNKEIIKKFTN